MWKKHFIQVISFGVILICLQYIFFFAISYRRLFWKSYDHNVNNHLGFSHVEYKLAKLEEIDRRNEYDLTGVLLHWTRLEGVRRTLLYLLRTNYFKEIIIWNNNPNVTLKRSHFTRNYQLKKFIRIINSKTNLKDQAKYRACTLAKTRSCFYVDDDWDVSYYLKSLIASYRSDPYLLHSVTDPYTYYTNLVWSYFDSTIDLHSGFSWIGCGSIFLRDHAERHLQFLQQFIRNTSKLINLSDVFFSIWLNDPPVQINTDIQNHPVSSRSRSLSFSSTYDFAQLQYRSSLLAIRILERNLRSNRTKKSHKITFSRQQNRSFPYYVKSPNLHDEFIFYTNVLPYELYNISFNILQDFERGTRNNLPDDPNAKYFSSHSTFKTGDSDLSTCWYASREIHLNDLFGIDFLSIQKNIKFTLAIVHSPRIQTNLDIRISFDGLQWLSYRSLNGIYTKVNRTFEQHLHTFLFDSEKFQSGFRAFRYISFKALEDFDHHFQICEIRIIPKKDIFFIKRDFQQVNI